MAQAIVEAIGLPNSVVILEDDAETSNQLRRSFEGLGMHVSSAITAAEAIEHATKDDVGAFIVDVNLGPGRTTEGIHAVERLRGLNPDAFIAVYTSFPLDHVERAREAGADIVLSKAQPATDVNRVLEEWLSRARAARTARTGEVDVGSADQPVGVVEQPVLGSDLSYSGLVGVDGEPISGDSASGITIAKSIVAVNAELIERAERDPQLLSSISSRAFEELVAEILATLGYNVTLTPPSRDGGVDILAAKRDSVGEFLCLVECKRYVPPHKVGVSLVRSLHGVLEKTRASAAMLVTTS